MPTARFTGRVLPAALNVSMANQPRFQWKVEEIGLDITFRVHISAGSIRIDCDVNKFESAHLIPLFMRAHDIARATVDLAAFATGNGLAVILEEFIDPSGTATQLAAQHPSLAALATAVKLGTPGFDKVLQVVLAEPAIFLALRDLIEAITFPQRATINCARAIGNLGPLFRPPGGSSERAWLALRENLQIGKAYVWRITRYSPGPEDGDHARVFDATATDFVPGAWVVMNRFFEYLKRGGQPLPLSEFPLLV